MKELVRCSGQRGAALIATILVLLVFLTLGAAALSFSSLDLKAANNDATGHEAFFLAEAGVQHAMNRMNRLGVLDFKADVADCWTSCADPARTLWGGNPKSMPSPYTALQYSVQVAADPADLAQKGSITSTGLGTSDARRVIRVGIKRGGNPGTQGAIYAASDDIDPDFNGNSFFIDGNDYDLNANKVAGGVVRPGIATRNDSATTNFVNELNSVQKDNVQGQGYVPGNPATPSVMTTGGPSVADLNHMISDLLAKPHVNWNDSHINGGTTLGTPASPQITYLTHSQVTIGNGHASGAGILIANGSLKINGTFDFVGWIIVRGTTTIENHQHNDGTFELGSGNILGSLWTGDFNIDIGGNGNVFYSAAALELAGGAGGGNSVPKPMIITSYQEVY